MKPQSIFWAIVVAVTLISGALGFWLGSIRDGGGGETGTASGGAGGEREILYWVAPMDPNYRRDQPGKSPMGMDLVPVYADGHGSGDDAGIVVSSAIRQSLGVRTARAERGEFARRTDTVGYTAWDGSTVTMYHPRAEGWLESFSIASVGDRVQAGQVLYTLFSPKLVSAQQEYLTARASGNASLTRAARDRLRALGLTAAQVEEIERRGRVQENLPRRASRDGVVVAMEGREGNYVMPGTHVLTIADLSPIWAEVEVFEQDIGWMEEGLPAEARFEAWPGETWHGRIAYIYPALDPATRTLRLRLVFDNADGRLRPNMLAKVRIEGQPRRDVLHIPREAVIRSGAGERVVLDAGEGRFRVQPVVTGLRSGIHVEVLEGLSEGDRVVTSGQFLLDAEAGGEQALARLEEPDPHAGHDMREMDHSGHDMEGMDHSGHDMQETDKSGHDMEGTDHSGHDMQEADQSAHEAENAGDADHGEDHAEEGAQR
jgi:Cu(I)/Ag(I) efflux system membrane fusion protein